MIAKTLSGRSHQLRAVIVFVAVAAVGYLGMALWAGYTEVVLAVAIVGFAGVGVALSLSVANFGLRYIRWHSYLRAVSHEVPVLPGLRIYLAGFALTASPGKVGELIRSVFLKQRGVGYADSMAVFLSDRLSDLTAVLALVAVGLWKYDVARMVLPGVAIVAGIVVILTRTPGLLSPCVTWSERCSHPRLRRLLLALPRLIRSVCQCMTGYRLLMGLGLSLLAWTSQGAALYVLATSMGAHLTIIEAVFVHSLSILAGALSFLPGGIGVTDLTMAGMLLLHGLDASQAVVCAILVRLVTLWFAIAVGVAALARLRSQVRVGLE